MDIGIESLAGWFARTSWPSIRCPKCGDGRLALPGGEMQDDLFNAAMQNWHEWGIPSDISGVFTARQVCSRSYCEEVVAVSGDFGVQDDPTEGSETIYRVRTTSPSCPVVPGSGRNSGARSVRP